MIQRGLFGVIVAGESYDFHLDWDGPNWVFVSVCVDGIPGISYSKRISKIRWNRLSKDSVNLVAFFIGGGK